MTTTSQEHEQICSGVEISDFNIEIDSKDYFNMNLGLIKKLIEC